MADSELARKLARRQQMIDEKLHEDDVANGNENENGNIISQPLRPEKLHLEPNVSISTNSVHDSSASERDVHSPISDGASDELRTRLARQQHINDGVEVEKAPYKAHPGLYAEFTEFTRKQLKSYEQMFKKYDVNRDGFICIDELKLMMEKLEAPQTHLALKQMIREVDEDQDNKINLREFLLIFRKAAAGELVENSGLSIFADLTAVDVTKEGVGGAKNFFEAKIEQLTRTNAFEAEIRAEQEERRLEAENKKHRRQEFTAKKAMFQNI